MLVTHARRPSATLHALSKRRPALLWSAAVNPRIPGAFLLTFCLWTAAAFAAAPTVPTLAPDQLHAGDRATVRTVFQGDSIETFEAEIVGVVPGGGVEGDLILARATSERVVRSGVAQGMSGSPVYVNGRLIGALSSGWSFSREPIFGITPIAEMLSVLDQPEVAGDGSSVGPTGPEVNGRSVPVRFGAYSWAADDDASLDPDGVAGNAAPPPATPVAMPRPLALPLSAGGLHAQALAPLQSVFGPLGFTVTPGGRASTKATSGAVLQPGSAVAVDLIRGDLNMSAIGTVTYRDGDKVLIFGHPFFQGGDMRMPLSTAVITTIIASEASSFKLGVPGRPVGIATQDRRAAVGGRLGAPPHLLPISVRVAATGRAPRTFHFESVEDRTLAPSLVSAATINSLMESGGGSAGQTVRWQLDLWRHGGGHLALDDVVASDAPAGDLVGGVTSPLRYLFNNPYQRLMLDSIGVRLETTPGRDQWTLRSIVALETSIRPGGTLHLRCELERWRGPREFHELAIAVPEELPDGRYVLWAGGGSERARYEAAKLPARFRPSSLEEAWQRLGALPSSDALYATLWAKAPEVTREGVDYPELPTSAVALLSSPQSAGERGRRGESAQLAEARLPLPGVLRGELLIEVNVDAKAP